MAIVVRGFITFDLVTGRVKNEGIDRARIQKNVLTKAKGIERKSVGDESRNYYINHHQKTPCPYGSQDINQHA